MTANTVATLLEAACEVQEEELSARCMALIEEQTEAVLASDAFVHSLSEDTLCRVLRFGRAGGAREGRGARTCRGNRRVKGGVYLAPRRIYTHRAHCQLALGCTFRSHPVLRC